MYTLNSAAIHRPSYSMPGNQSRVAESDAGFGLDRFAFTAGTYCFERSGKSYCPGWTGRCKVMARPKYHPQWALHGPSSITNTQTIIHFDAAIGTSVAHIKEWSFLVRKDSELPTTFQPPDSIYTVPHGLPTGTVFPYKAYELTKAGEAVFSWDSTLQAWFSFVAAGCGRL